jgi:hypothetical protein
LIWEWGRGHCVCLVGGGLQRGGVSEAKQQSTMRVPRRAGRFSPCPSAWWLCLETGTSLLCACLKGGSAQSRYVGQVKQKSEKRETPAPALTGVYAGGLFT